jgi:uroporphyrinogen-III synthase
MRLLVTRPEPDNARTAAALRARGHEVLLAPLLRIAAVPDADLGSPPWAGMLITSANGARAIVDHPRRGELLPLPLLAVGQSSAEAAREAGFTNVSSADGDARDLARVAAQRFAGAMRPLLYLAGEDRTGEMAVPGVAVRAVVVYRAAKVNQLPAEVLAAGHIDGVLHFSRRSVEAYVDCGGDVLNPVHFCMSARAAEPLRFAGASRIEIAARPNEASLLALVTPKS